MKSRVRQREHGDRNMKHGDRNMKHGDRKGRHYYTRKASKRRSIVVATLAVAMKLNATFTTLY